MVKPVPHFPVSKKLGSKTSDRRSEMLICQPELMSLSESVELLYKAKALQQFHYTRVQVHFHHTSTRPHVITPFDEAVIDIS